MSGIIWVASYPKSGNTWFRIFLTNLLEPKDQPADINDLHRTPIASARGIFDDEVGIEASDLTPDEIDRLRPAVYDRLAAEADAPLFMKVHDAYTLVDGKMPLFPASATQGVIYLIRNPLARCTLEELQRQERENGFPEKNPAADTFQPFEKNGRCTL